MTPCWARRLRHAEAACHLAMALDVPAQANAAGTVTMAREP